MSCLSSDTTEMKGSMDASRGEVVGDVVDVGCKSESLAHSIEWMVIKSMLVRDWRCVVMMTDTRTDVSG